MHESARLIRHVLDAMNSKEGKDWQRYMGYVRIPVTLDLFTWSIRDGKEYTPPAIKAGLELWEDGVIYLQVATGHEIREGVIRPNKGTGSYSRGANRITVDPGDMAGLRHELLHFAQDVGGQLIRLGQGRLTAADKAFETFGMPKKKARTFGEGAEAYRKRQQYGSVPTDDEHARADYELHPRSVSTAAKKYELEKPKTPRELANMVFADFSEVDHRFRLTPRRNAEMRSIFKVAARSLGLSGEVTPEIAAILNAKPAVLPVENVEDDPYVISMFLASISKKEARRTMNETFAAWMKAINSTAADMYPDAPLEALVQGIVMKFYGVDHPTPEDWENQKQPPVELEEAVDEWAEKIGVYQPLRRLRSLRM
jgi:hypothetical protein